MRNKSTKCPSCGEVMSTRTGELRCEKCGFILPMSLDRDLELNSPVSREKRRYICWALVSGVLIPFLHDWLVYWDTGDRLTDLRRAAASLGLFVIFIIPINYIFLRWVLFSRELLLKKVMFWLAIIALALTLFLLAFSPTKGLANASDMSLLPRGIVYLGSFCRIGFAAWFIRLMLIDLRSLRDGSPQEAAKA